MTKQQFVKRMALIQNHHKEQEEIGELINKVTDNYSVVTFGDDLVFEMINMIEEDLKHKDILAWWLYEGVDKVVYYDDGKEISVRTLEELYDYMVDNQYEYN